MDKNSSGRSSPLPRKTLTATPMLNRIALREELDAISVDEIVEFQKTWDELAAQAYRWDFGVLPISWAAVVLMMASSTFGPG